MKTSSSHVQPPVIYMWKDGILSCCLVLFGLVLSFYNKIRCNKHRFYYLFHYLWLYV
jgi:hypothetical protein